MAKRNFSLFGIGKKKRKSVKRRRRCVAPRYSAEGLPLGPAPRRKSMPDLPPAEDRVAHPATYAQADAAAYRHGKYYGNYNGFNQWLTSSKLHDRSQMQIDKLKARYFQGVEDSAGVHANPTSLLPLSWKTAMVRRLPNGQVQVKFTRGGRR